jgi:hypothetical protein
VQAGRVPTVTAVEKPEEAVESQVEGAVTPMVEQGAAAEGVFEQGLVKQATPAVAQKRYPRTDLIEVLSLLSVELYEFGPGKGPVFDALKSLQDRLTGDPTLTAGEREYFGIILTYLSSAWAGRPGSPLESATPSPEEIAELFQ